MMAFAFLSHHTAFMNFLGLSNPTAKRWSITAGLSVLCSLFIALFFAILGYVIFGMDVRDNILNSFPADDIWINLARGLLAFSLFFTYPMQFYPSRSAIDKILGFESEERTPTKRHHYGVTITFYLVILALGCAVRDLGIVYELVGGTTYHSVVTLGISYSKVNKAFVLPVSRTFYRPAFTLCSEKDKALWRSIQTTNAHQPTPPYQVALRHHRARPARMKHKVSVITCPYQKPLLPCL